MQIHYSGVAVYVNDHRELLVYSYVILDCLKRVDGGQTTCIFSSVSEDPL